MRETAHLLTFLILVATLLIVWRQSWRGRLRLFVVQSALLAALTVAMGIGAGRAGLVLVGGVFALLKVWIIPRALVRTAGATPLLPTAPGRSSGVAVLVAGALIVVAYVVMLPVTRVSTLPTRGAIPLAFAVVLLGLFVCVTGRDALGHIMGFLVFENGIFALAILATYGLPGLVEAGVFLDVLAVVLIMEGVVLDIRREHDSIEVDRLQELRG
ncbi:MAG TPA: hypothetical protein VML54_13990 [Candidatus Limnocylindrales bacterium]|nr:hypothetical protein [Candidatus Limnocylindrales bacterium]